MNLPSKYSNPLILGLEGISDFVEESVKELKIPFHKLKKINFANTEFLIELPIDVQEKDVLLFHSISAPVSETTLELLIAIDTIHRNKPHSLTLILPFLPFSRQDHQDQPTHPLTIDLLAKVIQASGKITQIITFDAHTTKLADFYKVPLQNLTFAPTLFTKILDSGLKNYLLVGPDEGSVHKFKSLFQAINKEKMVFFQKIRFATNQSRIQAMKGEISGKNVVLIDDMIDTAGTICQAAKIVKLKGAKKIYFLATHAIFSEQALMKLQEAHQNGWVDEVWVSDSFKHQNLFSTHPFIKVVSLAPYFVNLLKNYLQNGSFTFLQKEEEKFQKRLNE